MYHRGTLTEYNTWHDAAKIKAGIPADGKIGIYRGKPAPSKQRTIGISLAILHPINIDDYIWLHDGYNDPEKTDLSLINIQTAGWFPAQEI